jgi:hypothetical protein
MTAGVNCENGILYKKLAIAHSPPAIKAFVSEDVRRKSFEASSGITLLKKEELIQSGFFYWSWDNSTVCFHCGGKVIEWEEKDFVDYDHAKNFPSCAFINVIKVV